MPDFFQNARAFLAKPIPLLIVSLSVYAIGLQTQSRALVTVGIGLVILAGLNLIANVAARLRERAREAELPESTQERNVRWTRDFLLAFVKIGFISLAFFSSQYLVPNPYKMMFGVLGGGALLALAALLCGAVLGFIFGIPRARRQASTTNVQSKNGSGTDDSSVSSRAGVNTNLEEISDWLTKIIVGLGLTKLAQIPDYIQRFTYFIANSPGCAKPGCEFLPETVAFSVFSSFGAGGFLLGYLLTRLFLQQAFTDVENVGKALARVNAEAASSAPTDASAGSRSLQGELPIPSAPVTDDDIARAQQVSALGTKGLSRAIIRSELERLAREYEALRSQMSPGAERTVAMERIAKQMLSYGLVVSDDLFAELKASDSPGMRLAAILCLEMRPRPAELYWLAERLRNEQPFIGYHAALALRAAVRGIDSKDLPRLRDMIEQSLMALQGKEKTDRYRVLLDARADLENA